MGTIIDSFATSLIKGYRDYDNQSWAHAKTVAPIWHVFRAQKIDHKTAKYCVATLFWLGGTHFFIFNTWLHCRNVKKLLHAPSSEEIFYWNRIFYNFLLGWVPPHWVPAPLWPVVRGPADGRQSARSELCFQVKDDFYYRLCLNSKN